MVNKYNDNTLKEKVSNLPDNILIIAKYTITSPITYIDIQKADKLLL